MMGKVWNELIQGFETTGDQKTNWKDVTQHLIKLSSADFSRSDSGRNGGSVFGIFGLYGCGDACVYLDITVTVLDLISIGGDMLDTAWTAGKNKLRRWMNRIDRTDAIDDAAKQARTLPDGSSPSSLKKANDICSFTAGTVVWMCDGSRKPIEQVEEGELVWTRDAETGAIVCRPVVDPYANPDRYVVELDLVDGHGRLERIETTNNHPFWVDGRGWTRVDKLRLGDRIPSGDGGMLVVERVYLTGRLSTVYNFGVEEFRSYFVGESGAWVHNCFDDIADTVSRQRQYRHVEGRMEWERAGKGGYFNSVDQAQEVLDAAKSGRARVVGENSHGFPIVEYKGVTGYNNNPSAGYMDQPTNRFLIKGTAKPSVVPMSPTAGN